MNDNIEIVLIEDNPDDVELAMLALEDNKIANPVRVLTDGLAAVNYLLSDDIPDIPRIILLDLKLPKLDGLQVLERLKADDRTRRYPVIMLTTSREQPDIQRAYDLGANSYIVKPVDFDQFADAVRQIGFYWLILNQQ
jgi:CheY-like chemotaxis protein